jgi:hypothetical protein
MSGFADLMFQRAEQAYDQGRLAEAESVLRLLLGRSLREPHVIFLLGHLRLLQNDPAEAEALLRSAIELDGSHALAHENLGLALAALGRHREAREARLRAMELDPALAQAGMVKAFEALRAADFTTGWEEYEARIIAAPGILPRRDFTQRQWYGDSDLAGKTILLYAEQGHGDAIQFVRYVPMVAALGARVILEIHRPLVPLAATIPGVAQICQLGDALPRFDLHSPLMSLPLAFDTQLATIPADIPYLTVPRERLARWRRRLGARRRMRIGIAWSGNPQYGDDFKRSIPLADFTRILDRPECELHVIQNEVRASDKAVLDGLTHVVDHSTLFGDFADTAALISLLDLVIAVDTSVAHLAGAIGWPTWLLLPHLADWRWLADREDSPWYPTIWLFRQETEADWAGVLDRVARRLDEMLAEAHDPDAA